MTAPKEITVNLTIHLAPAERRALGYKRLRALYGVPQSDAAREAQAVTRGTAHDDLAALLAREIDRLTLEYLTAYRKEQNR